MAKPTFGYNFEFLYVPGEKFVRSSGNNCIVFICSKYNLMVENIPLRRQQKPVAVKCDSASALQQKSGDMRKYLLSYNVLCCKPLERTRIQTA
jgi:hypothetical protein